MLTIAFPHCPPRSLLITSQSLRLCLGKMLTSTSEELPRKPRELTKALCAVQKEHGAPGGRPCGWGRGQLGAFMRSQGRLRAPLQILSSLLPSGPACAWNFTMGEHCPKRVSHPGYTCMNLGQRTWRTWFLSPVPDLGIFTWGSGPRAVRMLGSC